MILKSAVLWPTEEFRPRVVDVSVGPDCSREGKARFAGGWGCAMSSSWLCSCSARRLASGFSDYSALWLYLENDIKKLVLHPEGF